MDHVVTDAGEAIELGEGRIRLHRIPAWKDNIIWGLEDVATGELAVVDGPEAAPVLGFCEARGLTLTTVFNTHTHGDHVGINHDLQKRGLLSSIRVYGPSKVQEKVPGLTDPVGEGDSFSFAGCSGRVLLTEGHLNGHVSYVLAGALFCGDTLFAGGCGYLFDGPPERMFDSLTRLAAMPPETLVCCAHEYTEDNLKFAWSVEPGNQALAERIRKVWALRAEGLCSLPSTVEEERATNPFLRPGSRELQRQVSGEEEPSQGLSFSGWFAKTRALKDTGAYKSMEDGALPL